MADTMTSEKDAPTSVESAAAMASDTMTANQIAEAYKASLREHQMGFWSAVKTYKKALAWTAVVCLAIIMEGYDCESARVSSLCEMEFWADPKS